MRLRDIPFSVIDFETTGLSAKSGARVVEVAVARVDPGCEPRLVLDTLVDPDGPVLCTSIHGITSEDVLGAPSFSELVCEIVLALDGSLVGAFNASFDMAFLSAEAAFARRTANLRSPPHVCLMWLRPLLGISKRCSLDAACEQHGLRAVSHRAAEDALACAHMWQHYVAAAESQGIRTLAELSRAGSHRYLQTLDSRPYCSDDFAELGARRCGTAFKPRSTPVVSPAHVFPLQERHITHARDRVRAYWHALVDALADGLISIEEQASLLKLRTGLGLRIEEVRAAHARLFADRLKEYAEDDEVSKGETAKLSDLRLSLQQLGWSPGS
jgi:DNA polymerase III epsilon subunit-like protein